MRAQELSPREVRRLERRLERLYKNPRKHRLVVLGESKQTRARHWRQRQAMKVQCWYWWHSGRLQGWLEHRNKR